MAEMKLSNEEEATNWTIEIERMEDMVTGYCQVINEGFSEEEKDDLIAKGKVHLDQLETVQRQFVVSIGNLKKSGEWRHFADKLPENFEDEKRAILIHLKDQVRVQLSNIFNKKRADDERGMSRSRLNSEGYTSHGSDDVLVHQETPMHPRNRTRTDSRNPATIQEETGNPSHQQRVLKFDDSSSRHSTANSFGTATENIPAESISEPMSLKAKIDPGATGSNHDDDRNIVRASASPEWELLERFESHNSYNQSDLAYPKSVRETQDINEQKIDRLRKDHSLLNDSSHQIEQARIPDYILNHGAKASMVDDNRNQMQLLQNQTTGNQPSDPDFKQKSQPVNFLENRKSINYNTATTRSNQLNISSMPANPASNMQKNRIQVTTQAQPTTNIGFDTKEILGTLTNVVSQMSHVVTNLAENRNTTERHEPRMLYPRLKELPLPPFSGEKPHEFWGFYEDFQTAIGKRRDIEESVKMQYLKDCLKKPAKHNFGGLQNSSRNYHYVVSELIRQYGDKGLIEESALERLEKMAKQQCEMLHSSLLRQYLEHRSLVREMKEYTQIGLPVIKLIKKAYPWELLEKVTEQESNFKIKHERSWDMQELLTGISEAITVLQQKEKIYAMTSKEAEQEYQINFVRNNQPQGENGRPSHYCKSQDPEADAEFEWEQYESRSLKFEIDYNCENDCDFDHDILDYNEYELYLRPEFEYEEEMYDDIGIHTAHSECSLDYTVNKRGLSQLIIFEADFVNPENGVTKKVFVFVDSGAERSLITAGLAAEVGLQVLNTKQVVWKMIDGCSTTGTTQSVRGKLVNKTGEYVDLLLQTIDQCTGVLRHNTIHPKDSYFMLCNKITLPEVMPYEIRPDILIGLDYYGSIMQHGQLHTSLPSGMMVTGSVFGPIVYGMTHDSRNGPDIRHPNGSVNHLSLGVTVQQMGELENIGITDSPSKKADGTKPQPQQPVAGGRGRPRKYPVSAIKPKRPVGRPRKNGHQ